MPAIARATVNTDEAVVYTAEPDSGATIIGLFPSDPPSLPPPEPRPGNEKNFS